MGRILKRIVFAFFLTLVFAVGSMGAQNPKYVFLFIGDGMSIPQRMMTEEFSEKLFGEGLYINTMPYQAITRTRAANSFITDSAASGTAIACGEKTDNGRLGVAPDGRRLESVAEVARDKGKKVGIISSVTLNHATPAAFYAHNESRGNSYDIALDLLASKFEFFGGGGIDRFDRQKDSNYKGNIYDLAREQGYIVVEGPNNFDSLKNGDKAIAVNNLGSAMPYAIDIEVIPDLADYTRKAIEVLENPKGFFIMVEGGKIDWMCHANDAATTLREVLEFDKTVKVAVEFLKKHPKDTLIVVTGDHETGGLTLGFDGTGYQSFIELLKHQTCSFEVFRNKVNAFASKNKDLKFDDILPLVTECFGLYFGDDRSNPMRVRSAERKMLKDAFKQQFRDGKIHGAAFDVSVLRCFNNKASIGWTSGAHTALPVNTTAEGVGAERFSGSIDNTDIAIILKDLIK